MIFSPFPSLSLSSLLLSLSSTQRSESEKRKGVNGDYRCFCVRESLLIYSSLKNRRRGSQWTAAIGCGFTDRR